MEIEGPETARREFLLRVTAERPPHSYIYGLEAVELAPEGYVDFQIRPSTSEGDRTALVLPDIATCADCVREIFDPANRRYRYPFTNCTHCGPRFSIIEALPYDRANTSMKGFVMCPDCRAEYEDPCDRRFHAQPNACPRCGPQVILWNAAGQELAQRDDALVATVRALRDGAIVAVKGLGGFHLLVRADDQEAVLRLRARKHREAKPLALMCPSLEVARTLAEIDTLEARALTSPEAPIVLCRRRPQAPVAPAVAPKNPWLGLMLPYTPLHHLLMADLGMCVVATSGNISDEPLCIDEREALGRLKGIADLFLVHNRPIVRHLDDSLVRVALGREMVLRRARGYAPLPVRVGAKLPPVLAVGGHLKNTVALGSGQEVFLSQHLGDLDATATLAVFERTIEDLTRLFSIKPERVMVDAHPDYLSTRFARRLGPPVVCVQHHLAHVLACMADNNLEAPVLGVAWDGTGYGSDASIWGGEFLRVTASRVERVAYLRPFRLPGGEQAIREPRRAALGLLYGMLGEEVFNHTELPPLRAFKPGELRALRALLNRSINSPWTSSIGRLFDAVASLLDLRQFSSFEGQAAMDVEFAVEPGEEQESYPMPRRELEMERRNSKRLVMCTDRPEWHTFAIPERQWILDWEPLLKALLQDLQAGKPISQICLRFHHALVNAILDVARATEVPRIALAGGCFQNTYLLVSTVTNLRREGFTPHWHQRIPTNDGSLSLGQLMFSSVEIPLNK